MIKKSKVEENEMKYRADAVKLTDKCRKILSQIKATAFQAPQAASYAARRKKVDMQRRT
jgi:hypothetical protein